MGMKVCDGGRCGRMGRITDVWIVEMVVRWCDDGGGGICVLMVVFPKLFDDLFTSHEGFQKGTKSTMPPTEVVDLSFLVASSKCLSCLSKGDGDVGGSSREYELLRVLRGDGSLGDDSFEEISMMFEEMHGMMIASFKRPQLIGLNHAKH
ncbi:hypothetical protein Tco_0825132 [Tanacetum coccineum]